MVFRWAWPCLIVLAGCAGDELGISVDVITDWTPGVDFVAIEVRSSRDAPEAADVEVRQTRYEVIGSEPWLAGVRVAELDAVSSGPNRVLVTLIDGSARPIAQRELVLDLTVSFAALVVITRSCRDVVCPAPSGAPELVACQGGSCVDPRCSPSTPEHCPPPICNDDGDCDAIPACTTGGICAFGVCLCAAPTPADGGVDSGMDTSPPECAVDGDCGARTMGAFGACDYADSCDEAAERAREVMTPRCVSAACTLETTTETEACTRDTDGTSCGMTTTGSYGACGSFANACDETGTQSRSITMRTCAAGSCQSQMSSESRGCTRSTEGTKCGPAMDCCGGVCHDLIFNYEHCGGCNIACDYPTHWCVSGGPTGLACECASHSDCAGSTGNCSGGLCVP
jgi:hypothetical protein